MEEMETMTNACFLLLFKRKNMIHVQRMGGVMVTNGALQQAAMTTTKNLVFVQIEVYKNKC